MKGEFRIYKSQLTESSWDNDRDLSSDLPIVQSFTGEDVACIRKNRNLPAERIKSIAESINCNDENVLNAIQNYLYWRDRIFSQDRSNVSGVTFRKINDGITEVKYSEFGSSSDEET